MGLIFFIAVIAFIAYWLTGVVGAIVVVLMFAAAIIVDAIDDGIKRIRGDTIEDVVKRLRGK